MTDKSAKVLRAALFTLVPAAYLSMGMGSFWRPASAYIRLGPGRFGPAGVSPYGLVFMAAVCVVSLLSLSTHRVIAALGLLACFLWVAATLMPVL